MGHFTDFNGTIYFIIFVAYTAFIPYSYLATLPLVPYYIQYKYTSTYSDTVARLVPRHAPSLLPVLVL